MTIDGLCVQVRSIWTTTTAGAWQRAVDWPEWRAALSQGHVPATALETPATALRRAPPRAGERGFVTEAHQGFVTEAHQAGERLRGAKGGTVARAGVGSILAGEREQLEPPSEHPSRPLLMGVAKGAAAEAMRIPMRRPSGPYSGTKYAEGDDTLDGGMEDEQAEEETSVLSSTEDEVELAAVIEQAQSKARGHGAADRWRSLMEMAAAEIEAKIEIETEIGEVGLAAHKGKGDGARSSNSSIRSSSSRSSNSSNRSGTSSISNSSGRSGSSNSSGSGNGSNRSSSSRSSSNRSRRRAKLAISDDEIAISEDELQIFDVEEAPDGTPLFLPATEQWINDQAMALGASGVGSVRGGFSAVGYFTVERQRRSGEIRLGFVTWLNLSAPFPPCECEEHLWSDLSPVICRLAAGAPRFSSSLIFGCFAAGVTQLLSALRRTRAHRRLARGRLLRALLLLGAAMPITNCRSVAVFERCRSADGGDEAGGGRHGHGGGNSTRSSGIGSGAARAGRTVDGGSNQTRSRSAGGPDVRAADAAEVRAHFEDTIRSPSEAVAAARVPNTAPVPNTALISKGRFFSSPRAIEQVTNTAPIASDERSSGESSPVQSSQVKSSGESIGIEQASERRNRTGTGMYGLPMPLAPHPLRPPSFAPPTPAPPAPAPPAPAPAAPRRHIIEYDGYEDARVLVHRGSLYLLANHEDCHGRRRLCLLRLAGDAASGTLRQEAVWELSIDEGPDGPFALQDNEKNWAPFVHVR